MILQTRYLVRWTKAFLLRFKGLLLLGIGIGILAFFVIRLIIPLLVRSAATTIGTVGLYNPDKLPDHINNLITGGLTKINKQGELEPGMAKVWESPDQGKTWIFHLDENIKWQDGKNLDSKDIRYDFKDVSVERPDKKTLVFKLKDKYSPFPYAVSKPVYKRGLMGVGDWKVVRVKITKEYLESIKLKNINGKYMIYRFYPTEERAKLAFKLGKVDKLEKIYNPSPLDGWKMLKVDAAPDYQQVITLFFNNKSDLLGEKSVRQALNYAVDKNASTLERAVSPISPLSWAYNPQVKNYGYDLKKATELYNTKKEANLNFFTTPTLLPIAEKIAKDWLKIGVKANITVTSVIPTEFDALLTILDVPKDPDQYSLWHSTQVSNNIPRYSNQRIDKLLEDGRAELGPEERKQIYLDFQRFLVEDCPAIFLYHPTVYNIERK